MSGAGRLLLVEDDEALRQVLADALRVRGYDVEQVHDVASALAAIEHHVPDFVVLDLNLAGESSLPLIAPLRRANPEVRIVILTGYASITTAVEAIKLGAVYYLAKPVDADEIVRAFERRAGDAGIPLDESPMSVRRLEWEHLQRVLAECGGNLSEAARRLNMHRRTLQRKLQKRPARR